MRLVLEIMTGGRAGQRIMLAQGETLRVGRVAAMSDVVIADDPTISGVHFSMEYLAEICRVRDLNSRNGLFVNGNKTFEQEIRSGDIISAGQTRFRAYFVAVDAPEASPGSVRYPQATSAETMVAGSTVAAPKPPPAKPPKPHAPPPAARYTTTQAAQDWDSSDEPVVPGEPATVMQSPPELSIDLAHYQPLPGHRMYAVVDASAGRDLASKARQAGFHVQSLFTGPLSPALSAISPYLVEIDPASTYLGLWTASLGKNAGVLLESPAEFEELFRHVHNLFTAHDKTAKGDYFRFYDPRVLRKYVPTCTQDRLLLLFGPIFHFFVEDEERGRLLRYTRTAVGAQCSRFLVHES